uniref:CSON008215 protein n=1 Tax=Culicoides sonorensis TaxID=179676 RepID=A0A336LNH9_CULSO
MVNLLNDLKNEQGIVKKTLIFGATKRRCEKINSYLNRVGFRSVVMHGDKSQQERENALKKFRNDNATILVATDVCARGLDVEGDSRLAKDLINILIEAKQKVDPELQRISVASTKDNCNRGNFRRYGVLKKGNLNRFSGRNFSGKNNQNSDGSFKLYTLRCLI